MIKILNVLLMLSAVTIFAASACDEEGTELPELSSVGSACTSDSECPGPGTPQCLIDGIFPLEEMANSDSGIAQDLADIYVPLPDGYCSNVPPCVTDADCGLGGGCFFPLRDVDPDVFDGMIDVMQEKFGLNDEEAASVAAFSDFGQCLKPCEEDKDCRREGYFCKTPLLDLLALVPDSDKTTFCIGEDL
jgi:hypothetical protein